MEVRCRKRRTSSFEMTDDTQRRGESIFFVAVFTKHIFHLDLFPATTTGARSQTACVLTAECSVSRVESDGNACVARTKLIAHA